MPARLVLVATNFGQKFDRCDPCRCGQTGLFLNDAPDILSYAGRTALMKIDLCDVEVGFIQAQWFDELGVAIKDPANLFGYGLVVTHPWG